MKQSPRIQSRKITDIIEKIVGIPEGKQNHKPGMHGFVVVQVAVFYAFFPSTLGGWVGRSVLSYFCLLELSGKGKC